MSQLWGLELKHHLVLFGETKHQVDSSVSGQFKNDPTLWVQVV